MCRFYPILTEICLGKREPLFMHIFFNSNQIFLCKREPLFVSICVRDPLFMRILRPLCSYWTSLTAYLLIIWIFVAGIVFTSSIVSSQTTLFFWMMHANLLFRVFPYGSSNHLNIKRISCRSCKELHGKYCDSLKYSYHWKFSNYFQT